MRVLSLANLSCRRNLAVMLQGDSSCLAAAVLLRWRGLIYFIKLVLQMYDNDDSGFISKDELAQVLGVCAHPFLLAKGLLYGLGQVIKNSIFLARPAIVLITTPVGHILS